MKIFIYLLVFFFVLFFTLRLKLKIKYIEKHSFSTKLKFEAGLDIYIGNFIKIFGFNFNDEGIHFLKFKIPFKKIKIDKNNINFMKKYIAKDNFKYFNPQIEKMDLKLNIGVEDVRFTVFFVFALSTVLSLFSTKYKSQINIKNYNYEIIPNYNVNTLNFKFSFKISEKVINIVKTMFLLENLERKKNLQ